MKIYTASFYNGIKVAGQSKTVHSRITMLNSVYPHILESYHYLRNSRAMVANIKRDKKRIFLDSGAFSAHTLGVRITVAEYGKFILNNPDMIEVASNLDVIGPGCEKESYDNLKALEKIVGPGIVCPVHHVRDDDRWLQRYLAEGYDYILLGGMVPETAPVIRDWLDRMWGEYLTHPDGTPRVRVHGFAMTSDELMLRYPWYSVDSTSWVLASGFGFVFMDIPRPRRRSSRVKVCFSEDASSQYDTNSWHYLSLDDDIRRVIRGRLLEVEKYRRWPIDDELRAMFRLHTQGVELGYTPEALAKSYGLRRVMCMEYYERIAHETPASFEYGKAS